MFLIAENFKFLTTNMNLKSGYKPNKSPIWEKTPFQQKKIRLVMFSCLPTAFPFQDEKDKFIVRKRHSHHSNIAKHNPYKKINK